MAPLKKMPKLDLFLLVDMSGSYQDDLPKIRSLDDDIYDNIKKTVPDSYFAAGSFIDFPTKTYGTVDDYPFRLDLDFTREKSAWTGAFDGMTARGGRDLPESQYEALVRSAKEASWRPDSIKVLAITTDADFHTPADDDGLYPGAGREEAVKTLKNKGIHVIAIKSGTRPLPQMDDIAEATGGSVKSTNDTSEEIAAAVTEGIKELKLTIVPKVTGCEGIAVSFSPERAVVTSGADIEFKETLKADKAVNTTSCQIDYVDADGGGIIASHSFTVAAAD